MGMGSFSYTCAVSGLPIEAGDRVRYYLLARNPYTDLPIYMHDIWFPRVYPLRAVYNDYGSVEDVEDGPAQQAWLDGFQEDLVERGWGDNSVHDCDTPKDMTFRHMLEAAWQQRLRVYQTGSRNRPVVPDGVPTIARLGEVITSAGLEVFTGAHGPKKIIISDAGQHTYWLRAGDLGGNTSALDRLLPAVQVSYDAEIRPGIGAYSHDQNEIFVQAKDLGAPLPADPESFMVSQAMIREDVWQALIAIPVTTWQGTFTVERMRASARKTWDAVVPEWAKPNIYGPGYDQTILIENRDEYRRLLKGGIPYTTGLDSAFRTVSRRANEMTESQIDAFLDTVGEFQHLVDVLSIARYMWQPSYANGPQFGEWKHHENVMNALAGVTKEGADRYRAKRAEWGD
jgi:hypothetical protein